MLVDTKEVERRVMADQSRPCLYRVAGPCQHPACREDHFNTLRVKAQQKEALK